MTGSRLFIPTALLCLFATTTADAQSYEFVNGRWFDGRNFVARTVFVSDGVIVATRPARINARFDLTGRFIVPPYGEAHNHNIEGAPPATVAKYIRDGIFYVKDPASFGEARANAVGVLNVPTSIDGIFSGGAFTSPGGHPSGLVQRNIARGGMKPGDDDGRFMYPIRDSADFERRWPGFLAHKTDFVKTLLLYSENHSRIKDDPKEFNWHGIDPALMPLVVRRAREAGLTVTSHVESASDFHVALAAGVDEINHLPGFRPAHDSLHRYRHGLGRYQISRADARLAARRGVTVVTTIGETIDEMARGDSSGLDLATRTAVLGLFRDNLRLLKSSGVRVVLGSDQFRGSTVGEVMSLRTLGVFDDRELLRMWSITTPRAIFPRRRIGCFDPGCEASFLVLAGNPLTDFQNAQAISMRMKQGVLLQ